MENPHTPEDAPTTLRLFFAVCVAALGPLGMGTVLGYSSPALHSLANSTRVHVEENSPEASWIGSIINLGALVGGLTGGFLADGLGRRVSSILNCACLAVGWAIIIGAEAIWMLHLGRIITGVAAGAFSMIIPFYIAEISPPAVRGMFGSVFQFGVVLGIALMYAVGIGLDWVFTAVVAIVIPAIMFIALFFVPESPYWLMKKNRRASAKKAMAWLRGTDYDGIDTECEVIFNLVCSDTGTTQNVSAKEVCNGSTLRPLVISLLLMVFQQWSGVNAVLFYTSSIFERAGSSLSPNVSTLIIGVVQILATVVSVLLSDRAGRRVLLLLSALIMAVSLAALGAYSKVAEVRPDYAKTSLSWLPIVCLVVYISGFSIGYGPIPWLMMSEIIQTRTKAVGGSICTGINWLNSFIVTYIFNSMLTNLQTYGCYWLYTCICIVNFIFVLLVVPETRGKSLEQIQRYFERGHFVYLLSKSK